MLFKGEEISMMDLETCPNTFGNLKINFNISIY